MVTATPTGRYVADAARGREKKCWILVSLRRTGESSQAAGLKTCRDARLHPSGRI